MNEADWLVLRKILGMTWKEMADSFGISGRQLLRYRQGEQPVDKLMMLAIEGLLCRHVHQKDKVHLREAADSLVRRMRR